MNDDELERLHESAKPTATLVEDGPPPIPVVASYPVPESWSSLGEEATAAPRLRSGAPLELELPAVEQTRGGWLTARSIATILAVVAVAEGALIAWLVASPPVVPPTAQKLPLTIESGNVGDIVTVDGRTIGAAPQELTVDAGTHTIRLLSPAPPPPPAVASVAPVAVPEAADVASVAAATKPKQGGLRLSAPVEVQVVEGDRVLGSSADGPVVMNAGTHRVQLVNSAVGFSEERTIDIKAGQIVALAVSPPDGRLNINAQPWAQVTVDGRAVGDTPLANLTLAAGQHEVVFRHPQLGERRETVVIKSGGLTRLSVTLGR